MACAAFSMNSVPGVMDNVRISEETFRFRRAIMDFVIFRLPISAIRSSRLILVVDRCTTARLRCRWVLEGCDLTVWCDLWIFDCSLRRASRTPRMNGALPVTETCTRRWSDPGASTV